MKDLVTVALACLTLVAGSSGASDEDSPARDLLVAEHRNAAGTFTLKTPGDWVVESRAGKPEVTEARGGGLVFRIVRRVGELGLDSWVHLSPDAKQAVLVTVDRALERQPARLHFIVDSEQAWQTLCRAATPVVAVEPDGGMADELSRLQRHCEELGLD